MGIELDVLVGHPEHELLFVATQVARAAGLKNFYSASNKFKRLKENESVEWITVGALSLQDRGLKDEYGRGLPHTTTLFTEVQVYKMLLRGN
ncbi:hypothetical protein [Pseudomonas putida]|uniref:hypothetical protein n=1 Tax=Pseudomonas putida TaxID=303 RepID=UPI0039E02A95